MLSVVSEDGDWSKLTNKGALAHTDNLVDLDFSLILRSGYISGTQFLHSEWKSGYVGARVLGPSLASREPGIEISWGLFESFLGGRRSHASIRLYYLSIAYGEILFSVVPAPPQLLA